MRKRDIYETGYPWTSDHGENCVSNVRVVMVEDGMITGRDVINLGYINVFPLKRSIYHKLSTGIKIYTHIKKLLEFFVSIRKTMFKGIIK